MKRKTKDSGKSVALILVLTLQVLIFTLNTQTASAQTITLVQSKFSHFKPGSGAWNVPFDTAPAEGNVVIAVIVIVDEVATDRITYITQTGVNWTTIVNMTATQGFQRTFFVWSGIVGEGAGTNVAFGLKTSTIAAFGALFEYSGLNTTNLVDRTASQHGLTYFGAWNHTGSTGATATTTYPDELWFGVIYTRATNAAQVEQTDPTNDFIQINNYAQYLEPNMYAGLAAYHNFVTEQGIAGTNVTIPYVLDTAAFSGAIITFRALEESPPPTPTPTPLPTVKPPPPGYFPPYLFPELFPTSTPVGGGLPTSTPEGGGLPDGANGGTDGGGTEGKSFFELLSIAWRWHWWGYWNDNDPFWLNIIRILPIWIWLILIAALIISIAIYVNRKRNGG